MKFEIVDGRHEFDLDEIIVYWFPETKELELTSPEYGTYDFPLTPKKADILARYLLWVNKQRTA